MDTYNTTTDSIQINMIEVLKTAGRLLHKNFFRVVGAAIISILCASMMFFLILLILKLFSNALVAIGINIFDQSAMAFSTLCIEGIKALEYKYAVGAILFAGILLLNALTNCALFSAIMIGYLLNVYDRKKFSLSRAYRTIKKPLSLVICNALRWILLGLQLYAWAWIATGSAHGVQVFWYDTLSVIMSLLTVRFAFIEFLIIEKQQNLIVALQESIHLTKGHALTLWFISCLISMTISLLGITGGMVTGFLGFNASNRSMITLRTMITAFCVLYASLACIHVYRLFVPDRMHH